MVNKVTLLGRVGREVEVKNFENGKIAKFSLATSKRYKTRDGEKKEETQWHDITVSGKLADIAEKYVGKGSMLYVEGEIKYKSYEKNGEKKYFTDIMAISLTMLGNSGKSEEKPPF